MLDIDKIESNPQAAEFCKAYLSVEPVRRMLLGRNVYGEAIANSIEVGFFIDDYTSDTEFLGKPIIKTEQIPGDALVVSTLLGKTFKRRKEATGNRSEAS